MTDGYVHTHPITIVKNLSNVMFLLVIPLVRGMFYAISGGGLAVWLRGAWFDILVLMLIAAIAAVRWYRQIYRADKTGIYYKTGIVIRSEGFIPIDRISTMAVDRVFWFKPIKAVILRADTNGGEKSRFDFEIIARRRDAEAAVDIRDKRYYSTKNLTKEFRPSSIYIAVLCAFMSNSFAGASFAAALVSKAGNILGEKLEQRIFGTLTELSQILAVGIPPFAALIAIIILLGWFIGFVRNLLSHAKFKAVRTSRALNVEVGVFTNRRYSILVKNINYLDIRQSLMTKLLRVYLVFISCTGYGKGSGRVSSLIPAGTKQSIHQTLDMLLPEIKPRARALRPNGGALIRYILSPLWACLLVPLGGVTLSRILPEWSEAIKILTVMAMLPSVWCLILKTVDFITAGITCDNETITLRYSRWFVLHTVVVPREKISMIHLRQSCFQVRDGYCDVLVYTYAEGKIPWRNMHRVKNVRIDYAREILNLTDEAVFA